MILHESVEEARLYERRVSEVGNYYEPVPLKSAVDTFALAFIL